MRDQTDRAYDEAQERAFRALPWYEHLKDHFMGAMITILVLELVFIAFGWRLLTILWD